MKARSNQRAQILDAAARTVEQQGAGHLTIDAVAAQAGLSKGGVLYHFPSKRALLAAMLEDLLESATARNRTLEAQLGDTTPLRAAILSEQQQTPRERAMSLALLAAAAEDPQLVAPAREFLVEFFDRATQGASDPQLARVLMLANEGLRYLGMLNLLPLSATETERLRRHMLALAERSS
jgi:AcrR family transcriptional regulator